MSPSRPHIMHTSFVTEDLDGLDNLDDPEADEVGASRPPCTEGGVLYLACLRRRLVFFIGSACDRLTRSTLGSAARGRALDTRH